MEEVPTPTRDLYQCPGYLLKKFPSLRTSNLFKTVSMFKCLLLNKMCDWQFLKLFIFQVNTKRKQIGRLNTAF